SEIRRARAIGHRLQAHAGDKDPVDKSFHDCGESLVPNGEYEHHGLGRKQTICAGGDTYVIAIGIVVVDTFLPTQKRIESLAYRSQSVDLVATRTQSANGLLVEGRRS